MSTTLFTKTALLDVLVMGSYRGIPGIGRLVSDVDRTTATAAERAKRNLSVLSSAAMIPGLAAAGIITEGLKQYGNFTKMTEQVRGQTNMTTKQLNSMRGQIQGFMREYGSTASDTSDAFRRAYNTQDQYFYKHMSAQKAAAKQTADAYSVVNEAAKASLATGDAASGIANTIGSVLHAYGLEASAMHRHLTNAQIVMAEMHTASADANTTLGKFAQNLSGILPQAKELGVSLSTIGGMYGTLTKGGVTGPQAQTQVRTLFNELLHQTPLVQRNLNALSNQTGIDMTQAFSAQGVQSMGLPKVLRMFNEALAREQAQGRNPATVLSSIITQRRGLSGMTQLLSNQGLSEGDQIAHEIELSGQGKYKNAQGQWVSAGWGRNAQGQRYHRTVTDIMAASMANTLPGQEMKLRGTLRDLEIQMGKTFAGPATQALKTLVPLLQKLDIWMSKPANSQKVQQWLKIGLAIGGVGAALKLGVETFTVFNKLMSTTPWMLIVTTGILAYTHWKGFRNVVNTIASDIWNVTKAIGGFAAAHPAIKDIGLLVAGVTIATLGVAVAVTKVIRGYKRLTGAFSEAKVSKNPFHWAKDAVDAMGKLTGLVKSESNEANAGAASNEKLAKAKLTLSENAKKATEQLRALGVAIPAESGKAAATPQQEAINHAAQQLDVTKKEMATKAQELHQINQELQQVPSGSRWDKQRTALQQEVDLRKQALAILLETRTAQEAVYNETVKDAKEEERISKLRATAGVKNEASLALHAAKSDITNQGRIQLENLKHQHKTDLQEAALARKTANMAAATTPGISAGGKNQAQAVAPRPIMPVLSQDALDKLDQAQLINIPRTSTGETLPPVKPSDLNVPALVNPKISTEEQIGVADRHTSDLFQAFGGHFKRGTRTGGVRFDTTQALRGRATPSLAALFESERRQVEAAREQSTREQGAKIQDSITKLLATTALYHTEAQQPGGPTSNRLWATGSYLQAQRRATQEARNLPAIPEEGAVKTRTMGLLRLAAHAGISRGELPHNQMTGEIVGPNNGADIAHVMGKSALGRVGSFSYGENIHQGDNMYRKIVEGMRVHRSQLGGRLDLVRNPGALFSLLPAAVNKKIGKSKDPNALDVPTLAGITDASGAHHSVLPMNSTFDANGNEIVRGQRHRFLASALNHPGLQHAYHSLGLGKPTAYNVSSALPFDNIMGHLGLRSGQKIDPNISVEEAGRLNLPLDPLRNFNQQRVFSLQTDYENNANKKFGEETTATRYSTALQDVMKRVQITDEDLATVVKSLPADIAKTLAEELRGPMKEMLGYTRPMKNNLPAEELVAREENLTKEVERLIGLLGHSQGLRVGQTVLHGVSSSLRVKEGGGIESVEIPPSALSLGQSTGKELMKQLGLQTATGEMTDIGKKMADLLGEGFGSQAEAMKAIAEHLMVYGFLAPIEGHSPTKTGRDYTKIGKTIGQLLGRGVEDSTGFAKAVGEKWALSLLTGVRETIQHGERGSTQLDFGFFRNEKVHTPGTALAKYNPAMSRLPEVTPSIHGSSTEILDKIYNTLSKMLMIFEGRMPIRHPMYMDKGVGNGMALLTGSTGSSATTPTEISGNKSVLDLTTTLNEALRQPLVDFEKSLPVWGQTAAGDTVSALVMGFEQNKQRLSQIGLGMASTMRDAFVGGSSTVASGVEYVMSNGILTPLSDPKGQVTKSGIALVKSYDGGMVSEQPKLERDSASIFDAVVSKAPKISDIRTLGEKTGIGYDNGLKASLPTIISTSKRLTVDVISNGPTKREGEIAGKEYASGLALELRGAPLKSIREASTVIGTNIRRGVVMSSTGENLPSGAVGYDQHGNPIDENGKIVKAPKGFRRFTRVGGAGASILGGFAMNMMLNGGMPTNVTSGSSWKQWAQQQLTPQNIAQTVMMQLMMGGGMMGGGMVGGKITAAGKKILGRMGVKAFQGEAATVAEHSVQTAVTDNPALANTAARATGLVAADGVTPLVSSAATAATAATETSAGVAVGGAADIGLTALVGSVVTIAWPLVLAALAAGGIALLIHHLFPHPIPEKKALRDIYGNPKFVRSEQNTAQGYIAGTHSQQQQQQHRQQTEQHHLVKNIFGALKSSHGKTTLHSVEALVGQHMDLTPKVKTILTDAFNQADKEYKASLINKRAVHHQEAVNVIRQHAAHNARLASYENQKNVKSANPAADIAHLNRMDQRYYAAHVHNLLGSIVNDTNLHKQVGKMVKSFDTNLRHHKPEIDKNARETFSIWNSVFGSGNDAIKWGEGLVHHFTEGMKKAKIHQAAKKQFAWVKHYWEFHSPNKAGDDPQKWGQNFIDTFLSGFDDQEAKQKMQKAAADVFSQIDWYLHFHPTNKNNNDPGKWGGDFIAFYASAVGSNQSLQKVTTSAKSVLDAIKYYLYFGTNGTNKNGDNWNTSAQDIVNAINKTLNSSLGTLKTTGKSMSTAIETGGKFYQMGKDTMKWTVKGINDYINGNQSALNAIGQALAAAIGNGANTGSSNSGGPAHAGWTNPSGVSAMFGAPSQAFYNSGTEEYAPGRSGNADMLASEGVFRPAGSLQDWDYGMTPGHKIYLPGGKKQQYTFLGSEYIGSDPKNHMGNDLTFGTPNGGIISVNHLNTVKQHMNKGQKFGGGTFIGTSGYSSGTYADGSTYSPHLCIVTDQNGRTFLANLSGSALTTANQNGTALSSSVTRWMPLINKAANKNGIPSWLLASQIQAESTGNPNAVNKKSGATGLMQLIPGDFPGVNAYNPTQNVMAGSKYLKQLYNEFGHSWYNALVAYNEGPGNYQKGYRFKQATSYASSILGGSSFGASSVPAFRGPNIRGGGGVSTNQYGGVDPAQEYNPANDPLAPPKVQTTGPVHYVPTNAAASSFNPRLDTGQTSSIHSQQDFYIVRGQAAAMQSKYGIAGIGENPGLLKKYKALVDKEYAYWSDIQVANQNARLKTNNISESPAKYHQMVVGLQQQGQSRAQAAINRVMAAAARSGYTAAKAQYTVAEQTVQLYKSMGGPGGNVWTEAFSTMGNKAAAAFINPFMSAIRKAAVANTKMVIARIEAQAQVWRNAQNGHLTAAQRAITSTGIRMAKFNQATSIANQQNAAQGKFYTAKENAIKDFGVHYHNPKTGYTFNGPSLAFLEAITKGSPSKMNPAQQKQWLGYEHQMVTEKAMLANTKAAGITAGFINSVRAGEFGTNKDHQAQLIKLAKQQLAQQIKQNNQVAISNYHLAQIKAQGTTGTSSAYLGTQGRVLPVRVIGHCADGSVPGSETTHARPKPTRHTPTTHKPTTHKPTTHKPPTHAHVTHHTTKGGQHTTVSSTTLTDAHGNTHTVVSSTPGEKHWQMSHRGSSPAHPLHIKPIVGQKIPELNGHMTQMKEQTHLAQQANKHLSDLKKSVDKLSSVLTANMNKQHKTQVANAYTSAVDQRENNPQFLGMQIGHAR